MFRALTIVATIIACTAMTPLKSCYAQEISFLGEELANSELPPSMYARTFRVPIFDVDSGAIRFTTAFRDMERRNLVEILRDYTERTDPPFSNAPVFRSLPDGTLDCDCGNSLGIGEFVISETPVRDSRQGRYVSLNDESYKAVMELIDFPLEDNWAISVSFSELVYTYNARAIGMFLDARGFDLVYSYGFMDSPTYPGREDTQFILVRERHTGRFIIAIRGTSGVSDVKTSVNATMVLWRGEGAVHAGFAQAMEIIASGLVAYREQMKASGQPVLVVGHSLGGAAAILLTLANRSTGKEFHSINYAPPPVGDRVFEGAYKNIGSSVVNMFLPGEELDTAGNSESFQWMRLVGEKRYLEDVGKTAGATHYVINYLKGILKHRGGDVRAYEQSLPLCVLEKFPCFAPGLLQFAPPCLFENWTCFEAAIDLVLGLEPSMRTANGILLLDRALEASLEGGASPVSAGHRQHMIKQISILKHQLLDGISSRRMRRMVLLRLGLYTLLVEHYGEARRFLTLLAASDPDSSIIQYFRIAAMLFNGEEKQAIESAVLLFKSNPPQNISERTKKLLWLE